MTPVVQPPITFRFPFPHELSPDHEAASANSVRWARQMGLATSAFAVNRLRQWNWGRLTGHCVPTARGEGLDLIAQWMTFGFLYDDQFNGTLGTRPDLALRVTEDMISTLYGGPGNSTRHAAQRALADILRRLAATRSQPWLARFRDHMREYFTGVLHQATYKLDFHALSHHDALALRRANIAMHPLVDLIEVAEHVEIPAALIATTQLQHMRRILVDLVIYQNDVFSLPKDRNQPEVNVVLALSRQRQLNEQQTLAEVETIIATEVARFQHAKSQLPALGRTLHLTTHDRARLDRYVHCLELMIHGCVYSHAECVRYATETAHTTPLNETGYIQDLHMTAHIDQHSSIFPTTNPHAATKTPSQT